MANLHEVFIRIRENRKGQKKLKDAYRDALDNSPQYKAVSEEYKEIKTKKRQIETDIKSQFSSEFTKLEDMKIDLDSDLDALSDIALTALMKGETVKVKDEFDVEYDPFFSVKFKKAI